MNISEPGSSALSKTGSIQTLRVKTLKKLILFDFVFLRIIQMHREKRIPARVEKYSEVEYITNLLTNRSNALPIRVQLTYMKT